MYRPLPNSFNNAPAFHDVESTIRGLTQDYGMAFNTGNYDQAAGFFAADGQFMPSGRESAFGPKEIERVLCGFGEAGYQDLRLDTLRVDHSGDLAVETGRYTMTRRQENGTTVIQRGKYVHAWRRLGTWLMIADCWNSNLPQT
ncbi:MAG TPA: nuclear transport factor 2 family protein [Terriglobales bacterium]|nr:nuclear transport factor 2 family protein [Terriglobales bacterium]